MSNRFGIDQNVKDYVDAAAVSGSLPVGGTIGQVLAKNSSTNGDASWATASAVDATARAAAGSKKRAINAQTGTSYTFALTDGLANGNFPIATFANAAAVTVTVPTNASVAFAVGDQIDLAQTGAGKVTLVGAGGVTLNSLAGNLSVGAQYGGLSLVKTATDTWLVLGNTVA